VGVCAIVQVRREIRKRGHTRTKVEDDGEKASVKQGEEGDKKKKGRERSSGKEKGIEGEKRYQMLYHTHRSALSFVLCLSASPIAVAPAAPMLLS
jgi:hypothetical protein